MSSLKLLKPISLQKMGFGTHTRALPLLGFDSILTNNAPRKKEIHPFNALYPWKSKGEFVNSLTNSIIMNAGEIIVINKPYGVPSKGLGLKELQKRTLGGVGASPYCLEEILPLLAERLSVPRLNLAKSAERYMSGPVILTTTDRATDSIKNCFLHAKSSKMELFSYLAITLGTPKPYSSDTREFGLSLAAAEGFEGKQPILEKDFSINQIKKGLVKLVRARHSTLSTTSLAPRQNPFEAASLVEIISSTEKHHTLRILMTKSISPILGDHLYGNRVQSILSVPLNIGPFNSGATGFQQVPDSVLKSLNVRSRTILPTFLHRFSLKLPKMASITSNLENIPNVKVLGDDLIIIAPLPSHFVYACESLGLEHTF